MICVNRRTPRIDPKFHIPLIVDGEGRSINAPLIMVKMSFFLKIDFFIYNDERRDPIHLLVRKSILIIRKNRISKIIIVIFSLVITE